MQVSRNVGFRPFLSRRKRIRGLRHPYSGWGRVGDGDLGGAAGWGQEYAVQG